MDSRRSTSSLTSSSLNIVECLCTACIPVIIIAESLIYSVSQFFNWVPLVRTAPRKLTYRQLRKLSEDSNCFTINDVEALYQLYKKMSSSSDDGFIHKEELQLALMMTTSSQNLFLDRVFDLFDQKRNHIIEFDEFVRSLTIFHPNASVDDKIDFLFRMYDLRKTGYIEREEVEHMLIACIQTSNLELSAEILHKIIDKTFEEADLDRDGRINRDEWKAHVLKHPSLLRNMTVQNLRDLTMTFHSFVFDTEVEE
ncbi:hypothetical protein LUZ60_000379 [Juncus effusus]|nr:hypothetical protein LUZ60_000379 [Juncus effusus]